MEQREIRNLKKLFWDLPFSEAKRLKLCPGLYLWVCSRPNNLKSINEQFPGFLFSVDIKLKFQTQFSGLKLERKPETRMPEKCMDRISVYFKLITSLDLHGRARIFVWRNRTYITAQQWPLYPTDFWPGTKVIFWGDMSCMHISSCIYLYAISPTQKSKSTLKIMQKSTLKSRNPLWNPEIHFEIQKSTLKSRNPCEIPKSNLKSEIHVKSSGFRNLVRQDAPWRTLWGKASSQLFYSSC